MSWFSRKDGERQQDQSSGQARQTRSSNRGQPTGQRNPITGDGMETGDTYTESGNRYGASSQAGYQPHGNDRPPHHGYAGQHHRGAGYDRYGQGQAQAQGHIFRNAQASKQMVYEVYGNCVTMLEELENRELRHHGAQPLPRSDIHLPDQQKYDDSTIQRKLETQLLLFQSQIVSCDAEIKDEVRQELKENTLVWNSMRENRKIPNGVTDNYVGKLFEVLETGKTEHPKEFYQQPTIDEAGMQNVMQGLVQGNHRKDMMDEEFKKNPDKKAKAPNVRRGEGISQGAERMARNNPQMAGAVDPHIRPNMR